MRLLLDANIFLEVLLQQARGAEAAALLRRARNHQCYITDFAPYAIGLKLTRAKLPDEYRRFLRSMVHSGVVIVTSLASYELELVLQAISRFSLDFDDAHHYVVATRRNLRLVSYDADFDRTDLSRPSPASIP